MQTGGSIRVQIDSYQYPLAHTGAKAFSILYSNHDNILGPMADDKPAKTLSHWST